MSDLAPKIAEFYVETPRPLLAGGAPLSPMGVVAELMRRFPRATDDEFKRGMAIADEFFLVDRKVQFELDRMSHPCGCGAPGDIILLDGNGNPTEQRRCLRCDFEAAAKTACSRCGGAMRGEDVRAGITLCEACDPDDIGWEDERPSLGGDR